MEKNLQFFVCPNPHQQYTSPIQVTSCLFFQQFFQLLQKLTVPTVPARDDWYLTQPSPYCLSSQSEPQHDILVPLASSTQWLICLGCSHLLQNLSPGPVASSFILLVPHSTYSWYGSATSHQQLVSLKTRKSQLSLFLCPDTAHTLFVEKTSSLFSCMFYKWISNAMAFIRESYGKHLH